MTLGKSDYKELWAYLELHREAIESALHSNVPAAPSKVGTSFNEAAEYCLFSGGKRLRPILTLLGCELVGGIPQSVLPAAVAAEFIHTSSLVFDDLPCMDDAAERRGVESLHQKFGEGMAVLVGLAYLSDAYGLISNCEAGSSATRIAAIREMVECVGPRGMIGGQAVDLVMAGAEEQIRASEDVRNLKTSALMRLTLVVGAILGGGDEHQLDTLRRFATLLGEAYQLSDDVLDLVEDSEIFSGEQRPLGLEAGLDELRSTLKSKVAQAKATLSEGFADSHPRTCLLQVAEYLCDRES
jgi:geranylgeranyl diphosphate synthase, type II